MGWMGEVRPPGARRPTAARRPRSAPPLPPARLVERRRLRDALLGAVPTGLAVLVAPGGFGKTVALADFVAHAPSPVAWLTVSPTEADLVAFVEAVVGVLRQGVPRLGRFGHQALRIARQTGDGVVGAVADQLAAELAAHGEPVGLVLDDFHAADRAGDVGRLVAALVERAPPSFFLAIASRTLPALPYARLLALGRMAGIPADDLRFTEDETARFLDSDDEDEARRVYDATGGWAAALALGGGTFLGAVDDYLEHEVFAPLSPDVRAFLLRAAVPPNLDEDLCRRLLEAPDGPWVLTRAHRAGLFVDVLPDGSWRIHDLFRDFLRARLRQTDPLAWERLNDALAADLLGARRPVEAITQLVEADLAEAAADVLLQHADQLAAEGRWGAIRGWLDRLPPRVVDARPRLLTLHARALISSSPTTALGLLDRAVEACVAASEPVGAAEALAYRAVRVSMSGRQDEAAVDCDRALELLGRRDHSVLATILRLQGLVAARRDDHAAAVGLLQQALACAERHRDPAMIAACERSVGWALTHVGDAGAGTVHYERALGFFEQLGDLRSAAELSVNLGHAYAAEGAADLARPRFEKALALAEQIGDDRARGYALDNLAIQLREAGDVDGAIGLLDQVMAVARRIEDAELRAYALDQLAQCHRLSPGGAATAEMLARQAIAEAERGDVPHVRARASATLAATQLAQGLTADALRTGREAAAALDDHRYRADRVRALLCAAVAGHAAGERDWLDDLLATAEPLAQLRNRGFLRAEATALGPALRRIAAATPAARDVVGQVVAAGRATATPTPRRSGGVQMPVLEVALLGRPELLVDGAPPTDPARSWTRRPTRLLFFLLEQARQGLDADAVIARLWPEAEPGQGQSLLWDTVARLRAVLSGADRGRGRAILFYEGGLYRLNPELPLRTDVSAFEANAARGLAASPGSPEELAALTAAERLYRGPYLEGVDESWVLLRRRELARLHLRVMRRLVERLLENGPAEQAVELSARFARLQPRSETACRLHVRALRSAGDAERAERVERAFARRTFEQVSSPA